jgi:hypothetical protein
MTQERIKTAKWLSELYAAVANGEELQVWDSDTEKWGDAKDSANGPNFTSTDKWWRIKPKPRKRWVIESSGLSSCDPSFEAYWLAMGEKITEWVEVLP